MTLVVGILCTDGVVIGTDSAVTLGTGDGHATIEQPLQEKISIFRDSVIVAGTGEIGLQQRFNDIMETKTRPNTGDRSLKSMRAIDVGMLLSREAVENFTHTYATKGRYGALVALACRNAPTLIEFGLDAFQPELKNKDCWYVSMGSGQSVADPLLGFVRRVFWGDDPPNRQDGVFAATMVLHLGCEMAPSGVSAPIQIAVLEQDKRRNWTADRLGKDKIEGHIANVETAIEYFKDYREALFAEDQTAPEEPSAPQ